MGLGPELFIFAVIALALLAMAAAGRWSRISRTRTDEPIVLALDTPNGWGGDWDRLRLFQLALAARLRLGGAFKLRLSARQRGQADLILRRTVPGRAMLSLAPEATSKVIHPELLPAMTEVPLSPAQQLAALLVLHAQARGAAPPTSPQMSTLKAAQRSGERERYLCARLDALEALTDDDAGRLREACDELAGMRGEPKLDSAVLALNCGSIALSLAELGDRTALGRIAALLEDAARPVEAPWRLELDLMRGRIMSVEAAAAEDDSMRIAALGLIADARARANHGTRIAIEASVAQANCLLAAPLPDYAQALAVLAAIEADSSIMGEDKARHDLAKARALFSAGVGRGDTAVIAQALAVLNQTGDRAVSLSSELQSELAEWRGRIRTELAVRHSDPQQARLAIADLDKARSGALARRSSRLDIAIAHAHGLLYETTREEIHYRAASRASQRTLSAAPGSLSAAERHGATIAAASLHLAADDSSPRREAVLDAYAAWESARASLPPGAPALGIIEMHRLGALALRKLSRLKQGKERVGALERAVGCIDAALEPLTAVSVSSRLRVSLLRMRGETLAELASLGAGQSALERSVTSYQRALEDAQGIARADALEGLAQVLTDLAATRGELPPAAAHDALEEAYGLLVANGAPLRANLVLSSSRRLGPRPANDPL